MILSNDLGDPWQLPMVLSNVQLLNLWLTNELKALFKGPVLSIICIGPINRTKVRVFLFYFIETIVKNINEKSVLLQFILKKLFEIEFPGS